MNLLCHRVRVRAVPESTGSHNGVLLGRGRRAPEQQKTQNVRRKRLRWWRCSLQWHQKTQVGWPLMVTIANSYKILLVHEKKHFSLFFPPCVYIAIRT